MSESESTLKKVVADVENLKSQLEDSKGNMRTSTAIVHSWGKARVNQPPLSGQLEGHYYGGPPAGVAPLRVPHFPPTFKNVQQRFRLAMRLSCLPIGTI
jgi:hypothetical protein